MGLRKGLEDQVSHLLGCKTLEAKKNDTRECLTGTDDKITEIFVKSQENAILLLGEDANRGIRNGNCQFCNPGEIESVLAERIDADARDIFVSKEGKGH